MNSIINGLIIDITSKKGAFNLIIEAWEQDVKYPDLIGKETTDTSGRFRMRFDEKHWKDNSKDKNPRVFFKVYDAFGNLLRDTRNQVYWTAEQKENDIVIGIGMGVDGEGSNHRISGTIVLANGKAAVNVLVQAFFNTLKSDKKAGMPVQTDATGAYVIFYKPEPKGNHLSIKVYDKEGGTLLAESETVYKAGQQETINLELPDTSYGGLPEFERILAAVIAETGNADISKLSAKKLLVLASDANIEIALLRNFQTSQLITKQYEGFLTPLAYALIVAKGGDTTGNGLFDLSAADFSHVIAEAARTWLIAPLNLKLLKQQQELYQSIRIRLFMDTPAFESKTSLSGLWTVASFTVDQQQKISEKYLAAKGDRDLFWSSVEKDSALKPLVPKLKLSTGLHNLGLGNTSLVKLLLTNKSVTALESLASWTAEMWLNAVNDKAVGASIPKEIPGKTLAEKKNNYARSMKRMVEYLYPTKAIQSHLQTSQRYSKDFKTDLGTFLKDNPGFAIEKNNVAAYLRKNKAALNGVKNKETFTAEIETLSLRYAIAPGMDKYEHVERLGTLGISSSLEVMNLGHAQFTRQYRALGGKQAEAQEMFSNARHVVNAAQLTLVQRTDLINLPSVLSDIKQDATWQNLFGPEDYCQCKECRSVYSPAAYLADLLHFLQKRELRAGNNAYNVLMKRRPDIKYILLNCDNAHVPLPYIDLVNEVLENAVSGTEAFSHQTTGTSAELRSMPEYINEQAYNKLINAQYPWNLPFDLKTETGRIFLKHLGVSHAELVSLFYKPDNTNDLSRELSIALSRVGLTGNEWKKMEGSYYGANEHTLWKYSAGTNLNEALRDVETFLQRTQLSYDELNALLKTKYINQDDTLRIEFIKACDLTSANFTSMEKASRKKIYSFVKLYRKLNVSIADLDRVLTGLNILELNEAAMIALAEFMDVFSSAGLPLPELVSWFGLMPTKWIGAKEQESELYEQVFLNKTIISGSQDDSSSVRSTFFLNANHDELNQFIEKSDEKAINYMAAALQITKEEVNLLTDHFGFPIFSLSALSLLFASASYSKFFGISIRNYILLRSYLNLPADSGIYNKHVADTVLLLLHSGIDFSDLEFLMSAGSPEEENKIGILYEDLQGVIWKFNQPDSSPKPPLTLDDVLTASLSASFSMRNETLKAFPLLTDRLKAFSDPAKKAEALGLLRELNRASYLLNKLNLEHNVEKVLISRQNIHFASLSFDHLTLILEMKKQELLIETAGAGLILRINRTMDTIAFSKIKSYLSKGLDLSESLLDVFMNRVWETGSDFTTAHLKQALEFKRVISLFGINKEVSDLPLIPLSKLVFEREQLDYISSVAKSKYGTEAWLAISKKLRDPLREKQRDALSSYLLAHHYNPDFAGIENLYSYYLIDTQMSACMQSSRILLAISTVQLFIQRSLMNLEPEVDQSHITNPIDKENELNEWGEWVWRKNYRVWESNRKIFLYPENWLEPEWRDDKTTYFKELEEELMQSELSDESMEQAYMNYLYKLETMSGIEIMALYEDQKNSTYYIFGRINKSSSEWYFRRYDWKTGTFSAWEKIGLDIQSSHLCPIILNGSLYLFWTVFSPQSKEGEERPAGSGEHMPANKYARIHLEWSKYEHNTWSKNQISDTAFDDLQPVSLLYYGAFYDKTVTENCLHYREDNGKHFFYVLHGTYYSFPICCFSYNTSNNSATVLEPGEYTEYKLVETPNSTLNFDTRDQKLVRAVKENEEVKIDNVILKSRENQKVQITALFAPVKSYDNRDIFYPQASYDYKVFIYSDSSGNYLVKPSYINGNAASQFVPLSFPNLKNILFKISEKGLAFIGNERFETELYPAGQDPFSKNYVTVSSANVMYPAFNTCYNLTDANSSYNWELFFHIPMMIANKLSLDQKFEEARTWYHYIFDPTLRSEEDSARRFWKFKPFYEFAGIASITELMSLLNDEAEQPGDDEYEARVALWEQNTFNPHLIARTRIIAYMKNVVMKYIDNLVSWADNLFRQDTMESLNEATQLYMLAWNVLGREPVILNSNEVTDKNYDALAANGLDAFSNSMFRYVETRMYNSTQRRQEQERENQMQRYSDFSNPAVPAGGKTNPSEHETVTVTLGYLRELLYFCLPPNQKLLGYWDLLRDRFYKLRNCRNIDGVVRQLPLYEPPIDPALLIKAKQAGLSLTETLIEGLNATNPHYRFAFVISKAIDYANDVRSLGAALISALEKKEMEAFSTLRAGHELKLLDTITSIKKNQIRELQENAEAMTYALNMANKRYTYYSTKKFTNSEEARQMKLMQQVNDFQITSQSLTLAASVLRRIPEFSVGYSGLGAHSTVSIGGQVFSDVVQTVADSFSLNASIKNVEAATIGQVASYKRRFEDWQHQADLASAEIEQVNKQILAARIRIAMSEKELENHELQIKQSREQQDVLQSKFTNKELYNWMTGQLKTLYFQSYQMAFDMAKKAEKTLNYELGETGETFIKFGYWDNLRQGLLSGDKLYHDLKRMETAYLERNKRLHEISKTISLAMIDAKELIRLRETGTCHIHIPDLLFDLDFLQKENGTLYNRHANRKIKSVSLTMPCVSGPYTGVNCVLTAGGQSIATSSAQNDSGMFQFNFNDERYLPFEGLTIEGGLTFVLNMNEEYRAFDYNSISDVMLHINYTAEEGKKEFASSGLQFTKLFSVKHEFSNEWFEAKNAGRLDILDIPDKILPYLAKGKVDQVAFRYAVMKGAAYESTPQLPPLPEPPETGSPEVGLPSVSISNGIFRLSLNLSNLADVDDVLLAVNYTME